MNADSPTVTLRLEAQREFLRRTGRNINSRESDALRVTLGLPLTGATTRNQADLLSVAIALETARARLRR